MGQSVSYAASKDAQVLHKREECALSMEQHGQENNAASKDAQVLL